MLWLFYGGSLNGREDYLRRQDRPKGKAMKSGALMLLVEVCKKVIGGSKARVKEAKTTNEMKPRTVRDEMLNSTDTVSLHDVHTELINLVAEVHDLRCAFARLEGEHLEDLLGLLAGKERPLFEILRPVDPKALEQQLDAARKGRLEAV
jgi:hypothetical protein